MSYLIISLVSLCVSALTFFSGFGLGTLLMPAFALFFPLQVAIAATAIVHLANNIFKLLLVGKQAKWPIVLRFSLPAAIMAIVGASLLVQFGKLPPISEYSFLGQTYQITLVKLVIGIIIIVFALFDLAPKLREVSFDRKYLPIGGGISGFFGGLSGNQGALRSAFLIKAGLDKEAFIATGVVSAVIVDITRLLVYGMSFYSARFSLMDSGIERLVIVATLAAFIGAFIGKQLLTKITLRIVQLTVGTLLIVIGCGLALGIV